MDLWEFQPLRLSNVTDVQYVWCPKNSEVKPLTCPTVAVLFGILQDEENRNDMIKTKSVYDAVEESDGWIGTHNEEMAPGHRL